MSFTAGSICKLNCCQNGRDLPEGNSLTWSGENGKKQYKCGCAPHFFVVISSRTFNKQTLDWSKIREIGDREQTAEDAILCVALPLDETESAIKLTDSRLVDLKKEDYIDPQLRRAECLKELSILKNNRNSILCHNICKVNIKKCLLDTIGYIHPGKFEEIIKQINSFLNRGLSELKVNNMVELSNE